MFPIRTYLYLRRPKIYNYVVSMVQLRRPRGIAANDPWIFQPDSMASVCTSAPDGRGEPVLSSTLCNWECHRKTK